MWVPENAPKFCAIRVSGDHNRDKQVKVGSLTSRATKLGRKRLKSPPLLYLANPIIIGPPAETALRIDIVATSTVQNHHRFLTEHWNASRFARCRLHSCSTPTEYKRRRATLADQQHSLTTFESRLSSLSAGASSHSPQI
jgi:hypothetical protein